MSRPAAARSAAGGARIGRAATVAILCAGCPHPPKVPTEPERVAPIVSTERGARGGRLITLDESGARQDALTDTGSQPTIDSHPTLSPDGRWLVFASTRGHRGIDTTSLWAVPVDKSIAPSAVEGAPEAARDPAWSPDGKRLVYSSAEGTGVAVFVADVTADDRGVRLSEPRQLTHGTTIDLSASWSPDGKRLVYMSVDAGGSSSIWQVALAGGDPERLTEGPADVTPTVAPDGTIAFASPSADGDADLVLLSTAGERRIPVAEPLTDETGPVFSADSRYLFSTSVYRSAEDARALLASIIFIDLREKPPVMRALGDPAAIESRIGVALLPVTLSADRMHRNPPYRDHLRRALLQEEIRRDPQP